MRRTSARATRTFAATVSARAARALASVACALVLTSCATKPVAVPENAFALLGSGASAWFSFPVAGNRELASLVAGAAAGDGLNAALDKTEKVCGAAYPDGEIRMIARGDYSRSLSGFAFPRSKGWKKTTVKGIGSWFSRDGIDASIPQNGLACVVRAPQGMPGGSNGMETVLSGLRNPGVAPVPANFAELAMDSSQSGVHLFVADAKPWVSLLLGPDVTLPVDSALVSAFPRPSEDGTRYDVSVTVTAKDDRTARAMLTVMRLAFPKYGVRADGRELRVEGISVSASALVDFAGNLYF